ncbi:hypothetical protein Q7A_1962 [Methylophaga nitratireducenticrescens]|uniref:GreAB-C-like domain-containing protein n=1 Tax=Methylophaga nitratireducenticrescens TaxID=754476 RepID=I1XK60_METNJ|nr:hypothetical protein [Methylophaga nitratireducenticrescens]AFI84779.1 hypothetical protein Q7A_1962 [Methylophaga nitratireducenticrescens]
MRPSEEERLAMVGIALELFPPSIKNTLISTSAFRNKLGIALDSKLSVQNLNISFKRSELFNSVRESAANNNKVVKIQDNNQNIWDLTLENHSEYGYVVRLSNESETIILDDFWPFSVVTNERLSIFNLESSKRQLPYSDVSYWRKKLKVAQLTDDEINDLQDDLNNTPYYITEKLDQEIDQGVNKLETMVPQNIKYYERLIGIHKDSKNISEYSQSELKVHLDTLLHHDAFAGIESALLMSSHSAIIKSLGEIEIDESVLIKVFENLSTQGELISQTGLVELGITLLETYPDLGPCIKKLLLKLVDKNEYKWDLLNALIILVDSELALLQLFQDKPTFYRRLASYTQAALIHKCILRKDVVPDNNFTRMILDSHTMTFYCQSLIDLRLDPFWFPDYQSTKQLKSELVGRLYTSALKFKNQLNQLKLGELFFDTDGSSPAPYFELEVNFMLPGPLEGNIPVQKIPPELYKEVIKEEFQLNLKGIAPLINFSQICMLEDEYIDQLIVILKDAKHQLYKTTQQDEILSILIGLASVAARTRNTELAAQVGILARRYRNYVGEHSQVTLLGIGLYAAAAHIELEEWLKYSGDWISELVYLPTEGDEAKNLKNWLDLLTTFEPRLYCKCGRALAALE